VEWSEVVQAGATGVSLEKFKYVVITQLQDIGAPLCYVGGRQGNGKGSSWFATVPLGWLGESESWAYLSASA